MTIFDITIQQIANGLILGSFYTLVALVESAGQLVPKADLLRRLVPHWRCAATFRPRSPRCVTRQSFIRWRG